MARTRHSRNGPIGITGIEANMWRSIKNAREIHRGTLVLRSSPGSSQLGGRSYVVRADSDCSRDGIAVTRPAEDSGANRRRAFPLY